MKFNMQGILEQAQKMQEEMAKVKDDASKKTASGESGAGMVRATVNGNHELIALKIAKEIVDPNDTEMLEDLIQAAVNTATRAVDELIAEEMNKISGMLPNIPGLNLPF
jgi:DNA-binding YbaB/EbfC family protein